MTCKWNREYFEGKPRDLWCLSKKIKLSKAGFGKIRQCYMNTFFLRPISFIQEPMDMNLNDSHYFAIENVILDISVQINAHKIRSYFWCHIYYKWRHSLHQLMQVSQTWMNEWMFICHAINSITGESMDVKIIVEKRPRETSWLISGAPHTVCLSLIKITLGNPEHISLCNCCYCMFASQQPKLELFRFFQH